MVAETYDEAETSVFRSESVLRVGASRTIEPVHFQHSDAYVDAYVDADVVPAMLNGAA